MGGNADRVYSVNPKHMRVNYPHYIDGSDPTAASYGVWAETAVKNMKLRIHLAELSRDTVDALPLGSGDVDSLSFAKITALDKGYQRILNDLPELDMSMNTVTAEDGSASRRIVLQRVIGLLSIHARRARFLRPFIQIRDLPEKFDIFRRRCLDAAQTVVDLASTALSDAVGLPGSAGSDTQTDGNRGVSSGSRGNRSPCQSGLIINHVRCSSCPLPVTASIHVYLSIYKTDGSSTTASSRSRSTR